MKRKVSRKNAVRGINPLAGAVKAFHEQLAADLKAARKIDQSPGQAVPSASGIRLARLKAGLTGGELARRIGIAPNSVYSVERGVRNMSRPTLLLVQRILRDAVAGAAWLEPAPLCGIELRARRLKARVSAEAFAGLLGFRRVASVYDIENGRRRLTVPVQRLALYVLSDLGKQKRRRPRSSK